VSALSRALRVADISQEKFDAAVESDNPSFWRRVKSPISYPMDEGTEGVIVEIRKHATDDSQNRASLKRMNLECVLEIWYPEEAPIKHQTEEVTQGRAAVPLIILTANYRADHHEYANDGHYKTHALRWFS